MSALQKKLLAAAALHVRPGGRIVYATCTTLVEENDDVIDTFLRGHADFSIDTAAAELADIPCFRTPFGRIFLPHQILACAIAVFVLKRGEG
jgi:16S rRNA C967 or C1407 C5-methylase (RsmB/RsmF family)